MGEEVVYKKECSKCNVRPHRPTHRYCQECANEYMREWRKINPMTAEQRRKDTARSYAAVYKKRGKLTQSPCRDCGAAKSQMHHEDYDKPLEVIWLCRPCHLALHRARGE